MLDRSLIDRRCSLADFWFLHDDPEMRGHRGRALLRERLEARSQRPPNETKGEKALWRLMEGSGRVVLPDRQHWLTLLDGERIRVRLRVSRSSDGHRGRRIRGSCR
jgi:hypothetical protein